jgi:hypothetical protein
MPIHLMSYEDAVVYAELYPDLDPETAVTRWQTDALLRAEVAAVRNLREGSPPAEWNVV